MVNKRTRVFLTGATGYWGRFTLDEFRSRADRFDVVALVLPTPADTAAIRRYEDMPNLEVRFGDLTDYTDVESCVAGADFVVHLGGIVSPVGDDDPELAHRVNVGSMRNIVRAVQAQPNPAAIGVVGIGTVAQTGDRNPPHHWGRIGDPLRAAHFDGYGQSKIVAEKVLVDSGLAKWVWLRQTGIFHPGMLAIRDPIMTHSPFEGVMEWVSAEDSARLLVNLCEDGVPSELWCDIYNIGGGESWRLTNWELQTRMTAAFGVRDVRKWYNRNWFATRNFHGQWYSDSDDLEKLIPFRGDTFDAALTRAVAANPSLKLAGKMPPWIVKNLILKPLTVKPRGTMAFIRDNDEAKINAYFGSHREWADIGDWSTFSPPQPDRMPALLDHGYDETKDPAEWTTADYAAAADFRGGELLSSHVVGNDIATPLEWRCADGHEFHGSPRLVLRGGHWCPQCVRDTAGYRQQAERNQFLAQLELGTATEVR
ncbi:NAD-dependent epimerase/dehydratase family protein [Mycolicibacterium setense]|uniref:NAD-dependent epimerase/dehydratase family protein n=1 Tax=Mycolicibacterium setense TaxID=431269 RepID=UPI000574B1C8|nr:NAD-dependent epimerase/dehydratase family protein [Mycolicibacterium setense]KHO24940.1 3-beta hydroxysteroid dehydrogenase [Mycolicibacterium setense]MCV7109798.1 NAD-dependent epimerase/dehydratase family protein [Mycolicibacterium setense]